MDHKTVRTDVLEIAYLEYGPPDGAPVVLLHGWPSDVADYADVAPKLAQAGYRVLVPWLRGFGPTRFLSSTTLRSGQQAALGADLRGFMDALAIPRTILAGYDWGGRAGCIVAALWPERVRGLVSVTGYNIQDISGAARPAVVAEQEWRSWYHWLLQIPRGRAVLNANRADFVRFIWRLWSPNWRFDDATFEASLPSFDNPDFIDVTIHSYNHRYGDVAGDPAHAALETALAAQPPIAVPTVVLHGEVDGVHPPEDGFPHRSLFTGECQRRIVPRAGHFLSREEPGEIVAAVLEVARAAS